MFDNTPLQSDILDALTEAETPLTLRQIYARVKTLAHSRYYHNVAQAVRHLDVKRHELTKISRGYYRLATPDEKASNLAVQRFSGSGVPKVPDAAKFAPRANFANDGATQRLLRSVAASADPGGLKELLKDTALQLDDLEDVLLTIYNMAANHVSSNAKYPDGRNIALAQIEHMLLKFIVKENTKRTS